MAQKGPIDFEQALRQRVPSTLQRDLIDEGIEMWRNERPDIDSSAKAIVARIIRLRELIHDSINESLQSVHLKFPSYLVLAMLRASGEPYELSSKKLKRTLMITSGGMSNLLDRLERQRWIERLADPYDGRSLIVHLTDSGKRLADEAMELHAEAEHRIVAPLEPREREVMAGLLRKVLLSFGSDH